MERLPDKLKGRLARRDARREAKKRQITQSARRALVELGFANTSLRDIAQKSDLSLGMLHYYFDDRYDLIIHCVATYKDAFVGRARAALEPVQGRAQAIEAFAGALATSLAEDTMSHRLWYDIRTQAMFDDTFRPIVAEIEEDLIDVVRLAFDRAGHGETEHAPVHYAVLDGVFRFVMQGQSGDAVRNLEDMKDLFRSVLSRFL
ncbi:TetR/AcrR family transcriptional regulator [Shimia aestuarii]|uniref:TetR/AcrR family transcriptional regulator n=1 Tax=Shimia aestuarii TaxID=254406 RepID=UPI001FB51CD8|nr:TetR/AcrR family transcriptional regulator [Shimia aestuarii]